MPPDVTFAPWDATAAADGADTHPDLAPQSEAATVVRWIAWAAIAFGGTGAIWGLIYLPRAGISSPRFVPSGWPQVLRWTEFFMAFADTLAGLGLVWTGILLLRGARPNVVAWLSRAALAIVALTWLMVPIHLLSLFRLHGGYGDDDLAGVIMPAVTNALAGSLVPALVWLIARHPSCASLLSRRPA